MKNRLKMIALCTLATLGSPLTSETIWAQNRLDVIVQSGQTVAGGNGTYSTFGDPALNNTGQAAFLANLTGTSGGVFDNQGIYLKGSSITQVVREGQSASGNGTYSSFSNVLLNNSGQVAFRADLVGTSGGTSDDSGIYRRTGLTTTQMARKGQVIPGTGGFTITSLGSAVMNNNGQVAFDDGGYGIYRANSGPLGVSLTIIALNSNPFETSSRENPRLNDSGQVAYNGLIQDFGFPAPPPFRWVGLGNGTEYTTIASNEPPSLFEPSPFISFSPVSLNNSGQVAFTADMDSSAGGGQRIYVLNTEITRTGMGAPANSGLFNGVFASFGEPLLNESGQVAFRATLADTSGGTSDDTGIFRRSGSSTTRIAREGQASPDGSGTLTAFSTARFGWNDSGQAAFRANIGLANIVLTGDGTDLIKVARTGDAFLNSTISGLFFNAGGLNEHGQIAYRATLANGTQVIGQWTPQLRWRQNSSSNWDTAGRWTLGLKPASVHEVLINPTSNVTVAGPLANTTVRSLQISGGTGSATLNLNNNLTLTATNGVEIASNGTLGARGAIVSNIDNTGTINVGTNQVLNINGSLNQNGSLQIFSNAQATVQGALSGNGFTGGGTLFARGELRPGNSTASVLYGGTLELFASSDTFIELGGLGLGQFDQLRVAGNFFVAGDLMVSLINGFQLSPNQRFLIGDVTGNRIGQFVGLGEGDLVGVFGGQQLFITYNGFDGNPGIGLYTATASTIVNSFVDHVGYTGSGSTIDMGKVLAKESAAPALLSYNNLVNSSRGINGLVFEVDHLAGPVTAADFVFQMSPTGAFSEAANPVSGWAAAPSPLSVTVTPGSPDRIAITWADNAIANRWLRVTILANANTGMAEDEVYYVGHLLGETTGSSGSNFTVAFADIAPIRGAVGTTVNSSSIHDIDKNGTVSFGDISAMRSAVGSQLTIVTIPAAGG